jgi:hypothetical protein
MGAAAPQKRALTGHRPPVDFREALPRLQEGGTGVLPVFEIGVERPSMKSLVLRPHGRDDHAPLFLGAKRRRLTASFQGSSNRFVFSFSKTGG